MIRGVCFGGAANCIRDGAVFFFWPIVVVTMPAVMKQVHQCRGQSSKALAQAF